MHASRAERTTTGEDQTLRQRTSIAVLIVLLICGAAIVLSGALRYGNRAQRIGDHETAKLWYQAAAYTGNANAQNNLAGFYAEGLGGERDDELAAKWFHKAAKAGVPSAKFNLSNFYEEGRGVPRDTRKAVQLLEEVGEHDPVAAFNAGNIYATGRDDFPKDIPQAIRWYERAASMGYASAQYNLATIYVQGDGVPKNFTAARALLLKAAQQSHTKAQVDYGLLLIFGAGGKQDVSEGRRWIREGAKDPATLALIYERIAKACKQESKGC